MAATTMMMTGDKGKKHGSAKSARATFQNNIRHLPGGKPHWVSSDREKDHDMDKVNENMASGMAMRVFADENTAIVHAKAPAGSNPACKWVVQVVSAKAAEAAKTQADQDTPARFFPLHALTIPLLCIGGSMKGIGKTGLDKFPATNMLQQSRMAIYTTKIPEKIVMYLERICDFPVKLYMKMFKQTLRNVAKKFDTYLFDSTDGLVKDAVENAKAKGMNQLHEEARELNVPYDKEKAKDYSFKIFTTQTGAKEEAYRCLFREDPDDPEELIILVNYPVFYYEDKGTKPPVLSMEQLHQKFDAHVQAKSLKFKDSDEKDLKLSEYILAEMLSAGYKYHPHVYETPAGPLGDPIESKKPYPFFWKDLVKRGSVVQFPFSIKGVTAGKYYGTKMAGKMPIKFLGSFGIGDLGMANQKLFEFSGYDINMECLLEQVDMDKIGCDDSYEKAIGFDPNSGVKPANLTADEEADWIAANYKPGDESSDDEDDDEMNGKEEEKPSLPDPTQLEESPPLAQDPPMSPLLETLEGHDKGEKEAEDTTPEDPKEAQKPLPRKTPLSKEERKRKKEAKEAAQVEKKRRRIREEAE